jgi:peptidoglycan/LPS O-acetylase OafA/YrhL
MNTAYSLLTKGGWRTGIPFSLGIGAPIVADYLTPLLDFGTLTFGAPAAGGSIFALVAVFATNMVRLSPWIVTLLILAGVPFGTMLQAAVGHVSLTTTYWWTVALVPVVLGVRVGDGFRIRRDG